MGFLWLLLAGFVIGIIAKMLTPGRDPKGCLVTSGIGIAGSLIATLLGEALRLYPPGGRAGFVGSVIGAILLLLAYHALRGKNP
jgi:uncharacterized membrane protein YeaQ/YmgE (transglycosylase-associated protein family)